MGKGLMGTLETFQAYVLDRTAVVSKVEGLLLDLQKVYEAFFQQVSAVRQTELDQLAAHIGERRGHLPEGLDPALDAAAAHAREELSQSLARHEAEYAAHIAKAEATRSEALAAEAKAHKENCDLDSEEEALKARNERLFADMSRYEQRIRQASTGFGFLVRLPEMRRLQADRKRLEQEQLDVIAHIERLRAKWAERAPQHRAFAAEHEAKWTEHMTAATRVRARIEHVRTTAERIVGRTALERVLAERRPEPAAGGAPTRPCPRCQAATSGRFFCPICAARLGEDRRDFEGSLLELAELNEHHRVFASGMRSCQELIGLVRGIRSGLQSFERSVQAMLATQSRYPVKALQIDVPGAVVEQGRAFDGLLQAVSDPTRRHPMLFAQVVGHATAAFGKSELQRYFETMGKELSKQAKRQWG